MAKDDLPGGPTDPEIIASTIRTGATWQDDRILVSGLRFSLHTDAGKWGISTREGAKISLATFERLKDSSPDAEPGFVRVDGLRFRLDLVDGWAELAPA
jgi:hypothetical protein